MNGLLLGVPLVQVEGKDDAAVAEAQPRQFCVHGLRWGFDVASGERGRTIEGRLML